MPKFWKHRRDEPVEQLLRAHRPEPRDEFATKLLGRVRAERPRRGLRLAGRGAFAATALTAIAVAAAVAAGGVHTATTSLNGIVEVGKHTLASNNSNGNSSQRETICHATGSASNPYVELTLPPSGVAGHEKHPGDIIPAPAGGCGSQTPGHQQYFETICHRTNSDVHPYVTLTLPPAGVAAHMKHPYDLIPAPPGGCPTSAPPIKHLH